MLLLLFFIYTASAVGSDAHGAFHLHSPIHHPLSVLQLLEKAKENEAECSVKQLLGCQDEFNRELEATTSADWTNYEVLRALIDTWLDKGVDEGLLVLCKARVAFFQCLGATYGSCISRYYFMHHGYTTEASSAYVEIFKELEFVCSGGILQSLQHWDCISQNKKAVGVVYEECFQNYTEAIEKNPSKMCDAAETMITCARSPYYHACGEDVGWWECERTRIVLDFDNHCPHLTCSYSLIPVDRSAGSGKPAHSVKVRSKRQAYTMENPQFMSANKMALYARLGANAEARLKRKKRSVKTNDDE